MSKLHKCITCKIKIKIICITARHYRNLFICTICIVLIIIKGRGTWKIIGASLSDPHTHTCQVYRFRIIPGFSGSSQYPGISAKYTGSGIIHEAAFPPGIPELYTRQIIDSVSIVIHCKNDWVTLTQFGHLSCNHLLFYATQVTKNGLK